jgi:2-dehydro-3-deoxy-D-arabinonate dehydratase
MKLCRFRSDDAEARVGLIPDDSTVLDLSPAGITSITRLLEADDPGEELQRVARGDLPKISLAQVKLLAPVERQEVWAAGVTYLRSKKARMEESDFSATAYDRVYDAPRPELFFKALPEKVVTTGEPVGIRKDARWNVPEPELALFLNSRGQIAGYGIGNDMSARDIEGENLLYLPQAKVYSRSCALGPCIRIGASEAEARSRNIELNITRAGKTVFGGQTSPGLIQRAFDDLAAFLFRSQSFPHGAVLLTGTGIVPPDDFTLREGDTVAISISGIGMLENKVVEV